MLHGRYMWYNRMLIASARQTHTSKTAHVHPHNRCLRTLSPPDRHSYQREPFATTKAFGKKSQKKKATSPPEWRMWEICRITKPAKRWESIRALVRSMVSCICSNVGRSQCSPRPGLHPLNHFKTRWPTKSLWNKAFQQIDLCGIFAKSPSVFQRCRDLGFWESGYGRKIEKTTMFSINAWWIIFHLVRILSSVTEMIYVTWMKASYLQYISICWFIDPPTPGGRKAGRKTRGHSNTNTLFRHFSETNGIFKYTFLWKIIRGRRTLTSL